MYGNKLCPHGYVVAGTMVGTVSVVNARAQNKVQHVLEIWGIFTNLLSK